MPPKKVAAVVTEYRRWSHADVILRNLLDGYPDGKGRPNLELVSVYTDQVPKADTSRDLAKKHGFTIADTVAGALTLGGKGLAVDAVLSIGEHGQYPDNDKGQKLYPRRRFLGEIAKVFETTGQAVPVFNDKHLAATWDDARWMYDTARKRMFPLMAGSSVPATWRRPYLVLPKGCELVGAVPVGYGPAEGYGFHALEGMQCMVERRKGGETGVAAVTCHSGKAMWAAVDRHPWAGPVLEAVLKLVPAHAKEDVREATGRPKREALTFDVEYRDGLRALVVMANGWVQEGEGGSFLFGGQIKGQAKPVACQFYLHGGEPFGHFAQFVKAIDSFIQTGHSPWPVERTLLTTGILDGLMTSRAGGGKRVETPHLDITYQPTEWAPETGEIPKARK
jgi:hypothetical protein